MDRRLALVTGASAGIGAAFAQVYAGRGWDVALTARRADRLEELAQDIRRRHGVAVLPVAADLADPAAPQAILVRLADQGRAVDALVNNAGYGVPGHYADTAWAGQGAFLQVMVTAPCELAHRLVPGMAARGFGRIVNVASLAGLAPGGPGATLYAASKAFLVRFSESLHLETRGKGVHVTALCPGFTRSEFHDVMGTRDAADRLPSFMWQQPESVVREGWAAVTHAKPVCIPGTVNKLTAAAIRPVPQRIQYFLGRTFNPFK